MKVWLDSCGDGWSQAWERPAPWLGFPHSGLIGSAPWGGWKTTMSPTLGLVSSRLVRTRCPMSSVGTIEGLGIRYGLTMKAWMSSASPTAMATVRISSRTDFSGDFRDVLREVAVVTPGLRRRRSRQLWAAWHRRLTKTPRPRRAP